MRTVGADGQPLGNEKMKLPLAHEISARAMARALLRGASAELDPLRRREVHSVRVRRGRGHNEGMGVVG